MNLIQQIEAEEIAKALAASGKEIPEFRAGDTLRVGVKVIEGERTRVQAYEGVVIARSNRGINSNFTVRKMSFGEGVERVFRSTRPTLTRLPWFAVVSCVVQSCTICAAAPANAHVSPSAATPARKAEPEQRFPSQPAEHRDKGASAKTAGAPFCLRALSPHALFPAIRQVCLLAMRFPVLLFAPAILLGGTMLAPAPRLCAGGGRERRAFGQSLV
jgi:ribosomal protein L19